jgi:pyruvate dehydrogenase (quinone)/pyruvate oxidase
MAKPTAGDVLVETLIDWGVDMVFGIPGDGINGIIESLRTRQDRVRFIQVRHEEAAAFAACGYAKWTGKLGVCIATSGPGGIHLLNGLYDAKLDGQPVLAITGLQFHDLVETFTQQDVELDKLYMDVFVYNARVMGPTHVENVVELACRTALAYRGVAHVTIPVDMQSTPVASSPRSERNVAHHVSELMAHSSRLPSEDQLARAADILNSGSKTAILAGRGAVGAGREVLAVAERLAAPIAKPLLGKAAVGVPCAPLCVAAAPARRLLDGADPSMGTPRRQRAQPCERGDARARPCTAREMDRRNRATAADSAVCRPDIRGLVPWPRRPAYWRRASAAMAGYLQ